MANIPINPALPNIPTAGVEIGAQMVSQRAALAQSITGGSGAALEATKLLGNVAPGIMSILLPTGALVITLLGLKTVITGKPPWKQKESLM